MQRCDAKERAMSILMNFEATKDTAEARRMMKMPVYGQLDTTLQIEHQHVPVELMDLFVDGWVAGKRGEPKGLSQHRKNADRPAWRYGYELAQQRRLYFSQALHSFLISEYAEW